RSLGIEAADVFGLGFDMLQQSLCQIPYRKWRPAGKHVVKGAPQRINIAADVRSTAVPRLLGRNVVYRADGCTGPSELEVVAVGGAGQTKIGQFHENLATLPSE